MEKITLQPVKKTEFVTCKFIGEFLVGDNIVKNAEALCRMHANNNGALFNKLMLVQMGSIVESSLDQIFYRARNHAVEGLPNIPEDERKAIAEKDVGRFAAIIDVMKKHKLLDGMGADIYDELHKFREYRNRVHIQIDDKPKDTPRREYEAFTTAKIHATQSQEAHDASHKYSDLITPWSKRTDEIRFFERLDGETLGALIDDYLPKSGEWLTDKELAAFQRLKAEIVRLNADCEKKGGFTAEAAEFYDKYAEDQKDKAQEVWDRSRG